MKRFPKGGENAPHGKNWKELERCPRDTLKPRLEHALLGIVRVHAQPSSAAEGTNDGTRRWTTTNIALATLRR